MKAREEQCAWLADLAMAQNMPIIILGKSFKPETNIVTGSPALLLCHILQSRGCDVQAYDPCAGDTLVSLHEFGKACFILATNHDIFRTVDLVSGSVLIDVWRHVEHPQDTITYIPVGIGRHLHDGA
ncbi:MAG: UDP binding domain-containing protein [Pseudomonadota bacterium]